jgi:pseudouridine synthase
MSRRDADLPEDEPEEAAGERLQRVLAQHGIASRRASEDIIKAGRVTVNGVVVTEMGTKVDLVKDTVRVDGKPLRKQKPRYLILNKPSGFITTANDERQRWTVMDLVNVKERVYPVGRLDRDTQGLLLLTNDGVVANRVMHPRYGMTKEYHVVTDRRPSDEQLQDLRDGILVNGRLVVPNECRLLRESREGIIVKIVLHEGLYHVVRTMMEKVKIDVLKLRRHRLGPLSIQGVPLGAWRDLTPGELLQLFEALRLPAEDADKANARRQIQLQPVGGFTHPYGEPREAGHPTAGASRPAPAGRPQGGPPARPSSPGRANDARSSTSHRDRRPRRSR